MSTNLNKTLHHIGARAEEIMHGGYLIITLLARSFVDIKEQIRLGACDFSLGSCISRVGEGGILYNSILLSHS